MKTRISVPVAAALLAGLLLASCGVPVATAPSFVSSSILSPTAPAVPPPAVTSMAPLTPTAAPQRTFLQRQPRSDKELSIDFPEKFVSERLAKAENSQNGLYKEQVLLFEQDYFTLGNDVGYGARFSSGILERSLERHVREFPEPGVRDMGDYVYLMYDTDKGSRLYLYYPRVEGQPHFNNGCPVLMKETLSNEQFQGLSVGDSIQIVGKIDPAVPLYIQTFDEATDYALEHMKEEGLYLTSVHLLSDGILKIEYERTEDRDYVIHSLVFRDDFTLDGLDGKTCYRILKEDYVGADAK